MAKFTINDRVLYSPQPCSVEMECSATVVRLWDPKPGITQMYSINTDDGFYWALVSEDELTPLTEE